LLVERLNSSDDHASHEDAKEEVGDWDANKEAQAAADEFDGIQADAGCTENRASNGADTGTQDQAADDRAYPVCESRDKIFRFFQGLIHLTAFLIVRRYRSPNSWRIGP